MFTPKGKFPWGFFVPSPHFGGTKMSKNLVVLSDVRLTKDAVFQVAGTEYMKVQFSVAVERKSAKDEAVDYIDVQLIIKRETRGHSYLEERLLKGKRVTLMGALHIDRWQSKDESKTWNQRTYVFVEKFNDLDVVDFQLS